MLWFFISIVILLSTYFYFKSKTTNKKKLASNNTRILKYYKKNNTIHSNDFKDKNSSIKINNFNIFQLFNINKLGKSALEIELKNYTHYIAYYSIRKLDNGNKYALIIGIHNSWVNVITLNRAKKPIYDSYGFNINEKSWSYGSIVLGAPQIREVIKNNMNEIREKMKAQEGARKEKEIQYNLLVAEQEIKAKEFEKIEQKRQAEFNKIQEYRKPIIEKYFTGLKFKYNANKAYHAAARKDCDNRYYDTNLYEQTCNCEAFKTHNYQYEKFDIRRQCMHLSLIIRLRNLTKRNKDDLEDFIIKNAKESVIGIYFTKLKDGRPFAVIAYDRTTDLFVATPKIHSDRFIMVKWTHKNKIWLSNKGGKKHNNEVLETLVKLFKK